MRQMTHELCTLSDKKHRRHWKRKVDMNYLENWQSRNPSNPLMG